MSPTSSPEPPPGADDPSIAVTVTPPPSGAGHGTATITIPQETWDKLLPPDGKPRCPTEGIGRFFCEHGETLSHVAGAVSSIVTAVAVIMGGLWAYHRYVRGRIYNPRSAVVVKAQWHLLDSVGHVLQLRVGVTNIGASKLELVPDETGVEIDFPAAAQSTAEHRTSDEWWADVRWDAVKKLEGQDQPRAFTILTNHAFIEPNEQVFDDLLLNLGRKPTIVRVRAQLCWKGSRFPCQNRWLYDYVDQIIPPGTAIYEGDNTLEAGSGGSRDG